MRYCLYKTTCTLNGKIYIGVHNGRSKQYLGSGTALKSAIKQHGAKAFNREDLETFDTEAKAFAREAEVVTEEFVQRRDTYNMKVGGKGGIGQAKSEDHRKKIAEAIKDKYNTDSAYRLAAKNAGRKPAMDLDVLFAAVDECGIKGAAKQLGLSFYQCRDRYYRAKGKF